jgi:hypothetical protein
MENPCGASDFCHARRRVTSGRFGVRYVSWTCGSVAAASAGVTGLGCNASATERCLLADVGVRCVLFCVVGPPWGTLRVLWVCGLAAWGLHAPCCVELCSLRLLSLRLSTRSLSSLCFRPGKRGACPGCAMRSPCLHALQVPHAWVSWCHVCTNLPCVSVTVCLAAVA